MAFHICMEDKQVAGQTGANAGTPAVEVYRDPLVSRWCCSYLSGEGSLLNTGKKMCPGDGEEYNTSSIGGTDW